MSADGEIKAGVCPCGADILIGKRYSVSTERPTTIRRVCQGYGCGRVNEIILTVSIKPKPAGWLIRRCICDQPLYIRSDYAGRGYSEYGPVTGLDRLIERPGDYKNRTVKMTCRCGCKWSVQIRFIRKKDGNLTRTLGFTVRRCTSCPRLEGFAPIEPKQKRGAKRAD